MLYDVLLMYTNENTDDGVYCVAEAQSSTDYGANCKEMGV